jgi:hypothetical protein
MSANNAPATMGTSSNFRPETDAHRETKFPDDIQEGEPEIRFYGNAKTKIEFVAAGIRASGIVSVTMLLAHEPPPVPTGTATYCLPFTA